VDFERNDASQEGGVTVTYLPTSNIVHPPPSSSVINLSYRLKEVIDAAVTEDPELTIHDIRTALQLAQPSNKATQLMVVGSLVLLLAIGVLYFLTAAG
jgi:hypothetical protein